MKIEIPVLVRSIPLREYAEELGEEAVWVWVNPPRDFLTEYLALQERAAKANAEAEKLAADDAEAAFAVTAELSAVGEGFAAWYARLWSQGAEAGMHWTADETRQLAALETDPALYGWLTTRSWALVAEHRSREKKK